MTTKARHNGDKRNAWRKRVIPAPFIPKRTPVPKPLTNCPRCHGLLVPELAYSPTDSAELYRCLNCGNVLDWLISVHRKAMTQGAGVKGWLEYNHILNRWTDDRKTNHK